MNNKSFTLIIPSYNCANYIQKNLLSIINSDYDKKLIQVIVVDDGSVDNSIEILEEFSKKYNYIEYHVKKNGQWGSVINYVKNNKLIKNDYVAVIDADDFYDEKVFKIINKISNNNDIIAGSFRKYNGKKITTKVLPYWFLFKRKIHNKFQMLTPFCLPLTFFSRKEIFYKLNDLTENIAYQDPDYLTQLINNSYSLVFTKKTIGYYYYNRENNSISQDWTEKRFNAELNACMKCIENDAQEIVSYRLNIKKFYKIIKEKNVFFKVNRKFNFSWYPYYIRWIYAIIHLNKYKKNFKI